jgi:hypothetical protein
VYFLLFSSSLCPVAISFISRNSNVCGCGRDGSWSTFFESFDVYFSGEGHKSLVNVFDHTKVNGWRMPSGMLHHEALIRTDVSEEGIASIIRVTRIGELGTLAGTSNRSTL